MGTPKNETDAEIITKQERREQKRRNRRKMAVHGQALKRQPRPKKPA